MAHFHHDPTLRKKQWQDLATLPRALFMANAIWLCDHNSVTLPVRDVANPKITAEATDVLEARDAQISFLMTQRKVYSVFSTVFLLLLLLAVAVGFPAACFG